MTLTINPAALDALRAFLDERARRGGNDDDPELEQSWYDGICDEPSNNPILEDARPFTEKRRLLLVEAFSRCQQLLGEGYAEPERPARPRESSKREPVEITKYTRALIDRATAQIVRELSRTPVADLQVTGAPTATPWISVTPKIGREGGVQYIRVGLGIHDGADLFEARGLIEAIAKREPVEAHRIVEELIVASLMRRLEAAAPC